MNLLLDTHAFLWWLAGDPLSPDAVERIADPTAIVAVSAASAWEISIKRSLGKLDFDGDVAGNVTNEGFVPLDVSIEHAERAGALPPHHRDPFDRMIIAQGAAEGLTVVTRDVAFDAYGIATLRC
jgi:PIN domain nuclease of toxin-antitoxin system